MITFFQVSHVVPIGQWGLTDCIHIGDWFLLYESEDRGLYRVEVVDSRSNIPNAGWKTAWCVRVGVGKLFEGEVTFSGDLHEFRVEYNPGTQTWVGSIGPKNPHPTMAPHHNGTWH